MKLLCIILIILTFSDTIFAISIPWRKYLPILGTVGVLGGLLGVIFLGTKADEAYKAAQVVTGSEADAKFLSLSPEEQKYVLLRMEKIGANLSQDEKAILEAFDMRHGWPRAEMPETSGMDKSVQKELKSMYHKVQKAMDKVERTKKIVDKVEANSLAVNKEHKEAQYNAALILGTDWKQACERAKGQTVEISAVTC